MSMAFRIRMYRQAIRSVKALHRSHSSTRYRMGCCTNSSSSFRIRSTTTTARRRMYRWGRGCTRVMTVTTSTIATVRSATAVCPTMILTTAKNAIVTYVTVVVLSAKCGAQRSVTPVSETQPVITAAMLAAVMLALPAAYFMRTIHVLCAVIAYRMRSLGDVLWLGSTSAVHVSTL